MFEVMKDVFYKLKSPERLFALLILMMLSKVLIPVEYSKLMKLITKIIDINDLTDTLDYAFLLLFVVSILYCVFIVAFIILKVLYDKYYLKYAKLHYHSFEDIKDNSRSFYSHFYGTQANAMILCTWMIVIGGYLHMLDNKITLTHINSFFEIMRNASFFKVMVFSVPFSIYSILLFISFLKLLEDLKSVMFLIQGRET
jgi:hypothetical protein